MYTRRKRESAGARPRPRGIPDIPGHAGVTFPREGEAAPPRSLLEALVQHLLQRERARERERRKQREREVLNTHTHTWTHTLSHTHALSLSHLRHSDVSLIAHLAYCCYFSFILPRSCGRLSLRSSCAA